MFTFGPHSYDTFSPVVSNLFKANLWTGDGTGSKAITAPGLGSGGVVWTTGRSASQNPDIYSSSDGSTIYREGPSGISAVTSSGDMTMSGSGFSLTSSRNNVNTRTYVGWSFGKSQRFVDFVTYTGNGAAGHNIPHSLGVSPGLFFVIDASNTDTGWRFYQIGGGAGNYYDTASAGAAADANIWSNTAPTSAQFTVGNSSFSNFSGRSYTALLFAHDIASDGIIRVENYTGNGSSSGPTISLGWQPQFILFRNLTSGGSNWAVADSTRTAGFSGNDERAYAMIAQLADSGWSDAVTLVYGGFQITSASLDCNGGSSGYMAVCIRA